MKKNLTPMELAALRGRAARKTDKTIASALGISPNSVAQAMQRVVKKFKVSTPAQAVHKGRHLGLVIEPAVALLPASSDLEAQVLQLVVQEKTYIYIARALSCSTKTVERITRKLREKYGVKTKRALATVIGEHTLR